MPLEALLIAGTGLEDRHKRVARALAGFDAATIATTHEFCLRMLDGLGVSATASRRPSSSTRSPTSPARSPPTSTCSGYAPTGQPPMEFDEAVRAGRGGRQRRAQPGWSRRPSDPVTSRPPPSGSLSPRQCGPRSPGGSATCGCSPTTTCSPGCAMRWPIPQHGAEAAQRLRDRYRVVLVDEFQDTDPIQWEILRRAFHGHTTLIMIGDPKQAIYAFRGADVYSYLDAVRQADQVRTLGTNWRSDDALVAGLDVLWGGSKLGDEQIVVRPVRAHQERRRLTGPAAAAAMTAPIRLRYRPHDVDADQGSTVGRLRPQITRDLVADVTAVLASGLQLELDGTAPSPGATGRSGRAGPQERAGRGDPGGPGRGRRTGGDARCHLGVRLDDGAGLADPAVGTRATAAAGGPAGGADLLLRLGLRAAGRGGRRRADRALATGARLEPAAGRPRCRRPAGSGDHRGAGAGATAARGRRGPPADRSAAPGPEPARRDDGRAARRRRADPVAARADGRGARQRADRRHPPAGDRRRTR